MWGSWVRVSSTPPKIPSRRFFDGFLFLVERSRKASLHAFCVLPHQRQSQKLFTQKTKVFLHIFTKSPKPCLWSRSATGLVPCVPQAQFVIASLVKRSAPLPVKFLPGGSKVGDVITARLRRLNFPYTLPYAIFNVCFLYFFYLGFRTSSQALDEPTQDLIFRNSHICYANHQTPNNPANSLTKVCRLLYRQKIFQFLFLTGYCSYIAPALWLLS